LLNNARLALRIVHCVRFAFFAHNVFPHAWPRQRLAVFCTTQS